MFVLFLVFYYKYDTTLNRQHTTDTIHNRHNTQQQAARSTHTTHTHSLPLPSSVVFLTIHDKLLIAQDVASCTASCLAPSEHAVVRRFLGDKQAHGPVATKRQLVRRLLTGCPGAPVEQVSTQEQSNVSKNSARRCFTLNVRECRAYVISSKVVCLRASPRTTYS